MTQIRITLLSGFALVAAVIASGPVAAQDAEQPYPNMPQIEQYLMDRDAEIALARSAAPDAISHDASITGTSPRNTTHNSNPSHHFPSS